MFGEPRYNEESPAYQALLVATEFIFADIRAGGEWSETVASARAPWQTRVGTAAFEGPLRKATLVERMRGREPLPPSASVEWQDDSTLMVYAFGMPEGDIPFVEELTVSEGDVEASAVRLVDAIAQALAAIDPAKTDSIKRMKLPAELAEAFPWMLASEADKRPDPWNM